MGIGNRRVGVVATALVLLGAPTAGAATITVNTRSDLTTSSGSVCSLREAVAAINTSAPVGGCPAGEPGGNTIVLAGGAPYTLTTAGGGSLKLSGVMMISGAGAASTTIDGGGIDRVLDVGASPAVSIAGVTISGGRAPNGTSSSLAGGPGGGIRNAGNLTLTGVTVSGNTAGSGSDGSPGPATSQLGAAGGSGGGVFNTGTLTIVRSIIAGNKAGSGGQGLYANPPSQPGGKGGDGGDGGGIVNTAGATLSVSDTSITANHAGAGGQGGGYSGGIMSGASGLMGGAGGAGGGLWNSGTVSLGTSLIGGNAGGKGGAGGQGNTPSSAGGPGGSGGFGGGLYDASGVSQTITNGTVAANAAGSAGDGGVGGAATGSFPAGPAGNGGDGGGGGGVVSAGSALILLQMTVSGNQVGSGGGGPGAAGAVGGGGGINAFGSATLQNTIVTGNSGGNCLGAVTDAGHNVSFPDTTCPGVNGDPKLGPLQDNGGPTQTMALGAGGAAIDQVPTSGAGCPATDQRGVARPQGPACDIGAFELGQAVPGSGSGGGGGGGGSGGSGGGGLPKVAVPVAGGLRISPSAFVAAADGPSAITSATHKSSRRKSGAKVSYTLSIASTVRFTVQQGLPGRSVGKGRNTRCALSTHRSRNARRCTRYVTLRGGFTRASMTGANRFHFTGRLNGHKLKPGKYTLVATPTAGGGTGHPVWITFRIVI